MKRIQSILMSLMVLALLSAGFAVKASADVRVSATLRTPGVRVHVTNSPYSRNRRVTTVQRTVVARHFCKVTLHDRNVALRLSSYTGVPVQRMIRLRSTGLGWYQIGNRLNMPRVAVRAAMRPVTWQRFLQGQRIGRCGTPGWHKNVSRIDEVTDGSSIEGGREFTGGWTYHD